MTLELFAAGAMLVGLAVYALTGGADFGGGILDLAARGLRRDAQRAAIERALAPVWEANHVWLIFVIVVLFTAFPPAFSRIGIDLHIPVTILLIAIVLRGSAFVFRQYGAPHARGRWGHVFAWSSLVASFFLGIILGGLTTGDWQSIFSVGVGVLTMVVFAFLAASYLCVEVTDDALREDFRRKALVAGLAFAIAAVVAIVLAHRYARPFAAKLVGSGSMIALLSIGTAMLCSTLLGLKRRRYRAVRASAIATVVVVIVGWAFAQYPILVAPDITIASAAAPRATLAALVPVLVVGSLILLPSLWWLMRVFKTDTRARH